MNKIIISVLLLILLPKVFATDNFNISQLDSLVKHIYNFEFEQARTISSNLELSESYKVLPIAYAYYWEFLSGNEPELNLKACNNCIKNKTLPQKSDSLQEVYQVSINLLQLRVHIARSNFVAPFLLFDDIHLFFKNNPPNNCSNFSMLYWGLYNYYIAHTRENSFATRYILNDWPESNKTSGIAILEGLTESSSVFVKTEALYFLTRIYLESEKNYEKAENIVYKLVEMYPKNYIYKWFYLRALNKNNKLDSFINQRTRYIIELQQSNFHTTQQKQHFKTLLLEIEN